MLFGHRRQTDAVRPWPAGQAASEAQIQSAIGGQAVVVKQPVSVDVWTHAHFEDGAVLE